MLLLDEYDHQENVCPFVCTWLFDWYYNVDDQSKWAHKLHTTEEERLRKKLSNPHPLCSADLIDTCICLQKKEGKQQEKHEKQKKEKNLKKQKQRKQARHGCGCLKAGQLAVQLHSSRLASQWPAFRGAWWWPVSIPSFISSILNYSYSARLEFQGSRSIIYIAKHKH